MSANSDIHTHGGERAPSPRAYRLARGMALSPRVLMFPAMGLGALGGYLGFLLHESQGWPGDPNALIGIGLAVGAVAGVVLLAVVQAWRTRVRRQGDAVLHQWARHLGLEPLTESRLWQGAFVAPFDGAPSLVESEGWTGTVRGFLVEAYVLTFVGTAQGRHDGRAYSIASAWSFPVRSPVELKPRADTWEPAATADLSIDGDAFASRWKVVGGFTEDVRAVLTPAVVRRLLDPSAAGLTVAWDGQGIHSSVSGHEGDVETWQRRLDLVVDLASLTPPDLLPPGEAPRVAEPPSRVGDLTMLWVGLALFAALLASIPLVMMLMPDVLSVLVIALLVLAVLASTEPLSRAVRRRRMRRRRMRR